MRNILTFDIEEYFDQNYPEIDLTKVDIEKSNLENEIKTILALCDKFQAKATFFILGRVASEKPHLVKMIQEKGHEIACHGFAHRLVYRQPPREFKEDLKKSLEILESITKKKVLGYRAPSWSFNEKTDWAYQILADLGIKYSASVFPIKTFLYGMAKAPRFPYLIDVANNKKVLEVPTSTIRIFNINIPFSGGAYFRFLPAGLIKAGIKKINREGKPAIVYLHPREIDPTSAKLKLPPKESFIHYWGVSKTAAKLESILKEFNFGSIQEELLPQYSL